MKPHNERHARDNQNKIAQFSNALNDVLELSRVIAADIEGKDSAFRRGWTPSWGGVAKTQEIRAELLAIAETLGLVENNDPRKPIEWAAGPGPGPHPGK